MAILYFLADAFIRTFGITEPTPRERKRAAIFILGLSLGVLVVVAVAAMLLRQGLP